MSVSIKTYILNIIDVLAKIVLPSVDSKFGRMQLSFAIDILNQLQNRVEYRNDVIKDDYAASKEILNLVCAALNDNYIEVPIEIISNVKTTSVAEAPLSNLVEELKQVETASARALDLMYEKKDEIKNFSNVEKQILELSLQWVKRKDKLQVKTITLELLESEQNHSIP